MMRHGKAFPHRIVAMINDAGYEKLKEESLARGYQIALIERWMLIPQSVEDLYTGNLDDADVMMRRPLPFGNTKDRGPKRTRRNIWLTDAGWEAVTRCAAKRGLVRSAYVAEVIHEQVRIANESGWPLPDGITNESVEKEIRDVLRKMEEPATAGSME
mgnify:FL=1